MQLTSERISQNTDTHFSTGSTSSDDAAHAHPNVSYYNMPTVDAHASSTSLAMESHPLDADTFPAHGTYLLPSEPNGTWRAHAVHLFKNSKGIPSAFCKVMELHTQELDMSNLLGKIEHIAEGRKGQINNWLNQAFTEYDLVEMHGQVQRLIPSMLMPSLRHLDTAIDMVSEIAQPLRKLHFDSNLPKARLGDNKWDFAQNLCHLADHALMEQGISSEKEKSLCRLHKRILHDMQSALIYTFMQIKQLHESIPLHPAEPRWVADQEKKAWRLELDFGRAVVEIGSGTDKSLTELGSFDTGFEISDCCGRS